PYQQRYLIKQMVMSQKMHSYLA
ncbi:MAG: hypothetical protein KGI28_09895, partial [Thaumarchaeota archaeon]|nr:hypothetical protein [Nitrososphaerota archaeon]